MVGKEVQTNSPNKEMALVAAQSCSLNSRKAFSKFNSSKY